METVSDRQSVTADGNTTALDVVGPIRLSVTGGFGGGTAKLQARDPGNNWVDVASASYTDVTDQVIDFPKGSRNHVRVNVAGSTTPTLVVWIQSGDNA